MTTYFACGKMLALEGVHTVAVAKPQSKYGALLYTDAGAFWVEHKDSPAVMLALVSAIAEGVFAYGGTNIENPTEAYCFDRVPHHRKHHD